LLDKASTVASALRPAVGYLRRSTDRQEQSLADQEAAIRCYANTHGFEVIRLYTDDAISGTSADNRPAFQRLIADASNGHRDFRFVLCYDVKRFSRGDNDEAGFYRHTLKQRGIEVVYASEGFKGDDTDDLVRPVKQFLARQESKDLSKVTLRGQLSSIHAGSYLGGVPPYGYDYLYIDSKDLPIHVVRFNEKGEKYLLDPADGHVQRVVAQGERLSSAKDDRIQLVLSSPDRVAIIRRIFDEYLAGLGYRAICDKLNAERVPSPRSRDWDAKYNGQWGISTVRNILINPVYAGDTCWNRRTQGKFHRVSVKGVVERNGHSARVTEPNPREAWIITRDTHEAIVSRVTFEAAQSLRAQRDREGWRCRNPRGRGKYSNYLLSGVITCGDCGHTFHGYAHKSRACYKDPSLPRPRYYLCGGYVTKGNSVCKRRAYPQEPLESYLIGRLQARFEVFMKKGGEKAMRRFISEAMAAAGPDPKKALSEVRAEIARLKKDVDRLLDNLTKDNRDFVDDKLSGIRSRLRDLQAKEEDLLARPARTTDIEAAVEAALAQVRRFRQVLARGTILEQKELVRGFIAGITITPSKDRGVITWYDLPASFKIRGGNRQKLYRRMKTYAIPKKFGKAA
jgi:site-specific DNA recombinase